MAMTLKVLRDILLRPSYLLTATVVAVGVFTFAVWLPNFRLIYTVLTSDTIVFIEKLKLFLTLFGSIQTNFTVVSASYTIAIAVLFGINVALLVYYIRTVRGGLRGVRQTGAAGIGGLISGVLGIGCAACGTFILTSVLALFGATGAITLLPLGGEEFGIIGVALLLWSLYVIAKQIEKPLVCNVYT
jgi:hypothetical protein